MTGQIYILIGIMGRKYYKEKPYSVKVLDVIARHYNELKQRLCPIAYGNYAGRSTEDIFSDTICVVIQDETTKKLKTDEEILKFFEYRFKMVSFQVIKDQIENVMRHEGRMPSNEQGECQEVSPDEI